MGLGYFIRTRGFVTKDFFIGFLACACLFLVMGTAPINIRENEEANFYDFIQKPTLMVATSTPLISNIRVGQPYFLNSGGAWMQTKIATSTYRVQLTRVEGE